MRILDLFLATLLVTEVVAECTADNCLRAIQDTELSLRKEDCKSFLQATITPATSTILHSVTVTTTGTTTRTTTQTITNPAEPSKRWLERHEIIDVLLGRSMSNTIPVTIRSIPEYASPCVSSAAYQSACSCIGVSPATVTAPTPIATQTIRVVETTTVAIIHTATGYVFSNHNGSSLFRNSTSAKFGNSTTLYRNVTSSGVSSSSSFTTGSNLSLKSNGMSTSNDKYRLKSPSIAEVTSSTEVDTVPASITSTSSSIAKLGSATRSNSTANALFPNATASIGKFSNLTSASRQSSAVSVTGFLGSTAGTVGTVGVLLNATSSAPFLNSTHAATANVTSITTISSNATTSAPFMIITSAPSLHNSSTLAPFLNSTNITSTARFANSTSSSVRFANTTTVSPTATPTSTALCETVSDSFALRVAQPGGLFDGWYVQLSGDGAIFNPSIDRASRFSLDSGDENGQHLCSLGGAGLAGNASAVVAITENRTDAAVGDSGSGSAVYFVDPELLDEIENKQHGWYVPLECNGAGMTPNSTAAAMLACEQGAMEYWVGCGLGLDITSDGGGVAVVDGWNCTSITLSIEYSLSS